MSEIIKELKNRFEEMKKKENRLDDLKIESIEHNENGELELIVPMSAATAKDKSSIMINDLKIEDLGYVMQDTYDYDYEKERIVFTYKLITPIITGH